MVTLSHDLHASVDELLPQLRFLRVHVVADCAAREGSDPCTDEGALATFAAVVARDDACDGAGGRTNHGALRRLRRLLVAGIGVRRGAGSEEDAEGQRAQRGRAGEILFHHFESEAILGSSLAAVQASRTTSPGNDIGFPFSAPCAASPARRRVRWDTHRRDHTAVAGRFGRGAGLGSSVARLLHAFHERFRAFGRPGPRVAVRRGPCGGTIARQEG